MVFVSLGTQDKQFPRLLQAVERLIDERIINEEVIAQIGQTKYKSDKMKLYDYINKDEMLKMIEQSSYVITHGGVGNILDALKLNKKVIAVARLQENKEHVNNHQLQIIQEYTRLGYILDGTYDLRSAIRQLNNFTPKKYIPNNDNFVNMLNDYIENN